jgi:hypothetical protein
MIRYAKEDQAALFNVVQDPGEKKNLGASATEQRARLEQVLERWIDKNKNCYQAVPKAEIDETTLRQLKSLGYIQ